MSQNCKELSLCWEKQAKDEQALLTDFLQRQSSVGANLNLQILAFVPYSLLPFREVPDMPILFSVSLLRGTVLLYCTAWLLLAVPRSNYAQLLLLLNTLVAAAVAVAAERRFFPLLRRSLPPALDSPLLCSCPLSSSDAPL